MEREIIGASAIALVAVIASLIYLSNRSVRKAQESALPEPSRPTQLTDGIAAFYVSTVFADSPLKRVWAWGLGGRGKALVTVEHDGVSIERQGELGLFLSRDVLTGVSRASATIDKGVEKDGLIAIGLPFAGGGNRIQHSAIEDDDPVLFFEHKFLYRRIKEELPSGKDADYVVPIGKADRKSVV